MGSEAKPMYIGQSEQDALLHFCKSTQLSVFNPQNMDLRARFKHIDQEYIRENNLTDQHLQAKYANLQGNKRKIQDIVIPMAEPQTDSMLAYLSSVFLGGVPIFGVVAGMKDMPEAKMLEAVVKENSTTGGWVNQFMLNFLDGLKYNFSCLEAAWCEKKIYSLETDIKKGKNGQPKEIVWEGNEVKRIDPYNTLFDPRIKLTEQYRKAEYCGYVELHNRVSLADYLQALPYRMNVTKAFESTVQLAGGVNALYYVPEVFMENMSPSAKMTGVINWDLWSTGGRPDTKVMYKNIYHLVIRYLRIVPKDYKLNVPAAGNVQIWKVITVNDAVIVYAERLTNAHNYLPMFFGQPIEDGLNLQTKSFAQKQIPLQDIASALANSKLASRRRLVSDRGLYDPSRVDEKHINSDNPSAKIPVRPTAYGQDMSKAYYPIPFKDDQTTTLMQDVREIQGYGDYLSGQNKSQQGQFVKGNKTKSEYDDVQSKSSGRQQLVALRLEHQQIAPLKHVILLNILQYQPTGEIYSDDSQAPINIDPVAMRQKGLKFEVSDGLDPAEKLMSGDVLTTALQGALQSPELNEEYDVGAIFGQLLSVKSNFDMSQFKRSQAQIDARNQQRIAMEQAKRTPPGQPGQPTPQGQPSGIPVQ